jgi:hypothetical protein
MNITQIYSIDVLVLDRKTIECGPELGGIFIPDTSDRGTIAMVSPHNALETPNNILDGAPYRRLKEITYTIIGLPDGHTVGIQRYHHTFKGSVFVTRMSDRLYNVNAQNGALVIPYQMDVLFDTTRFKKTTGIQFIA